MLTVHAYPKTMRARPKAAAGSDLMVLGVTVLTSMDDADVPRPATPRCCGLVALRAQQAKDAGIGGWSCRHARRRWRGASSARHGDRHPGHSPKAAMRRSEAVMGPAERCRRRTISSSAGRSLRRRTRSGAKAIR